jgi:hypothetical protein
MTSPQPFTGSPEEQVANYRSHRWDRGYDARCFACDAKAGSITSFWPCGVEPPRGPQTIVAANFYPIDEIAEAPEREPGGML